MVLLAIAYPPGVRTKHRPCISWVRRSGYGRMLMVGCSGLLNIVIVSCVPCLLEAGIGSSLRLPTHVLRGAMESSTGRYIVVAPTASALRSGHGRRFISIDTSSALAVAGRALSARGVVGMSEVGLGMELLDIDPRLTLHWRLEDAVPKLAGDLRTEALIDDAEGAGLLEGFGYTVEPDENVYPAFFRPAARNTIPSEWRSTGRTVDVRVTDAKSGKSLRSALVVAGFGARTAVAQSNGRGLATVPLPSSGLGVTELWVQRAGYWNGYKARPRRRNGILQAALAPLDVHAVDFARRYHPPPSLEAGRGVTVGVIDTGIRRHDALRSPGGGTTR